MPGVVAIGQGLETDLVGGRRSEGPEQLRGSLVLQFRAETEFDPGIRRQGLQRRSSLCEVDSEDLAVCGKLEGAALEIICQEGLGIGMQIEAQLDSGQVQVAQVQPDILQIQPGKRAIQGQVDLVLGFQGREQEELAGAVHEADQFAIPPEPGVFTLLPAIHPAAVQAGPLLLRRAGLGHAIVNDWHLGGA